MAAKTDQPAYLCFNCKLTFCGKPMKGRAVSEMGDTCPRCQHPYVYWLNAEAFVRGLVR